MSSPNALEIFLQGAVKAFIENPSDESAQIIIRLANTIRENTTPPCSGGCCQKVPPESGEVEEELSSPGLQEHGIAEGGAGSEELVGEANHDSDEEMYDSGSDDNADDGEVVPMSGIDTRISEYQLSNIHGYKQLYLPMSKYGHVLGEGVLPSGIGCSWLPSEEERNTEWKQCACVRAGKIQLVVAKTPNELCQEHCAGDWCPCPGMQKKWIYRHFGTLDVSNFERCASKELIDMWQLARRVADPDGWVPYGTIREYFSLENYHEQCQAFYKLRDVWKILVPSNIPQNSTSLFQLKPQFR